MRNKFYNLDFIKILNFNLWKICKRLKRHVTDWEKICAECISDKGFISKLYKEFLKSK